MGSAASTLLSKANMSRSKRPLDASDLINAKTGRQDRKKAVEEIIQLRKLCKSLLLATTDDPSQPLPDRYPAAAVDPPTLQQSHLYMQQLLPKRKLDFDMLSKLPFPCTASKVCCQSALQLCLDELTPPTWCQTQSWLHRRPYNDVRFLRVESAPSVWITFETVVATLENLIQIDTAQLNALGERGKATKALWMWSLAGNFFFLFLLECVAVVLLFQFITVTTKHVFSSYFLSIRYSVCNSVLENQDKKDVTSEAAEQMKEEIWAKAWEQSPWIEEQRRSTGSSRRKKE